MKHVMCFEISIRNTVVRIDAEDWNGLREQMFFDSLGEGINGSVYGDIREGVGIEVYVESRS